MNITTTKKLNNGVEIPMFGLGVFLSPDGPETSDAVRWAIEAGYRHIDTAKIYKNEAGVAAGIKQSGIKREKLFITTKLWNEDMRQHRQMEAFEESLKKLDVDYVDLYLIHWPVNFVESWKVLEEIYRSGRARAIGVSNFQQHHINTLMETAKITPAINQIEIHPMLTQRPLIDFCEGMGIACEAWSPLGGQGSDILGNPAIGKIAAAYGKTPAQIIIRWHLQNDVIVFPKSVHKDRIISNADVFDFELSAEEMAAINALNKDQRVGPDPDNFNF